MTAAEILPRIQVVPRMEFPGLDPADLAGYLSGFGDDYIVE